MRFTICERSEITSISTPELDSESLIGSMTIEKADTTMYLCVYGDESLDNTVFINYPGENRTHKVTHGYNMDDKTRYYFEALLDIQNTHTVTISLHDWDNLFKLPNCVVRLLQSQE